jgi:hypothetical protein
MARFRASWLVSGYVDSVDPTSGAGDDDPAADEFDLHVSLVSAMILLLFLVRPFLSVF